MELRYIDQCGNIVECTHMEYLEAGSYLAKPDCDCDCWSECDCGEWKYCDRYFIGFDDAGDSITVWLDGEQEVDA